MASIRYATTLTILALATITLRASNCIPTSQETVWGGNEKVVIVEHRSLRSISGTVVSNPDTKEGWSDVLVEVYDHPEVVLQPFRSRSVPQKRIVGCKTDKSGQFGLKLPAGQYEIRLSYGSGVDVTSIIAHVSHSPFASRKKLTTMLHPGT